jgi:FMN phosphatase YigB (HAD superfamily)
MSGIAWVVFDLGGVLVEVNQQRIFERLSELTELPATDVQASLALSPSFWSAFGVSEVSPAQLAHEVNRLLQTALPSELVVEAFNCELGEEIEGVGEIVRALKPQVKLACLSNTNSIHWETLHQEYDFMRHLDVALASQRLGCAKPGQEIYQKAAAVLSASPAQLLFFDDKIENVQTANDLGWNARQCFSTASLIAGLKEFRLA